MGGGDKSPAECCYVGVHPTERESRFPTPKGYRGETLTVACAYAPNRRSEYSTLLETLNGVLHGAAVGDY